MEKKLFEKPEVKVLEITPRTVITASECFLDCYGDGPCSGIDCLHDGCTMKTVD